MYDNPRKDWERIALLTYSHVRDSAQYDECLRAGMQRAQTALRTQLAESPVPSPSTLQLAHRALFREVYPFAGQFRQVASQFNELIGAPWQCAFHTRIEPELARLEQKMEGLLVRASTTEEKAQAITLQHAQLLRIHPFVDGNGRVARFVLESQLRSVLGTEPREFVDAKTYREQVLHANQTGLLGPLCYVTTGVRLPDTLQMAPYKMDLWPAPISRRTERGTPLEVICKDHIQAELVNAAPLTERLSREVDRRGHAAGLAMRLEAHEKTTYLDLTPQRPPQMPPKPELEREL